MNTQFFALVTDESNVCNHRFKLSALEFIEKEFNRVLVAPEEVNLFAECIQQSCDELHKQYSRHKRIIVKNYEASSWFKKYRKVIWRINIDGVCGIDLYELNSSKMFSSKQKGGKP